MTAAIRVDRRLELIETKWPREVQAGTRLTKVRELRLR